MIKLLLFDIDGVITDGKVYTDGKNLQLKSYNLKDMDALTMLKEKGIVIGCISGENTAFSQMIGAFHAVSEVHLGCKNKLAVLKEIAQKYNIDLSEVCYIGDGKYDIAVLKEVGISVCPADAIEEVKEVSTYTLNRKGGDGCLAELCTLISKNQEEKKYE